MDSRRDQHVSNITYSETVKDIIKEKENEADCMYLDLEKESSDQVPLRITL